jgi:hypothetical protein
MSLKQHTKTQGGEASSFAQKAPADLRSDGQETKDATYSERRMNKRPNPKGGDISDCRGGSGGLLPL